VLNSAGESKVVFGDRVCDWLVIEEEEEELNFD
jgi:hypothetical protein